MREIIINFKKEFKKFLKRKYMVKWFLTILLCNLLFVILDISTTPVYSDLFNYLNIPVDERYSITIMYTMLMFSSFIPVNLSLDTVLGEKKFNTMETLISMPMTISNIFLGKMLFIMLLAIIEIVTAVFLVNISMLILKGCTLISYFSLELIIYSISSSVLTIIIISYVTIILSLINNNPKLIGYIGSFVGIAFTSWTVSNIIDGKVVEFWFMWLVQVVLISGLLVVLKKDIKKSVILKYV